MNALVRENEVIPEPFSDWVQQHIEWLTTPRPEGDGYKLINDYQPPAEEPEISNQ